MNTSYHKYDLFLRFVKTWLSSEFQDVNRKDKILLELESMMEKNKQFFPS